MIGIIICKKKNCSYHKFLLRKIRVIVHFKEIKTKSKLVMSKGEVNSVGSLTIVYNDKQALNSALLPCLF